jgi:hypothetical protein
MYYRHLPMQSLCRQVCNEIRGAAFETCGCEPLFYDPDLMRQPRIQTNETEICFVCGTENDVVTQLDVPVTLPTMSSTCGELATAARMGQFSSIYCQEQVQPRAQSICGCATPILPDNEIQFHDTTLDTTTAPSTSPSPTISHHPAAETSETAGGFVCEVCGQNVPVINPDAIALLYNGVTTCSGLEAAGLAGVFSASYCAEEVITLANNFSCCSSNSTTQDDILHDASANHSINEPPPSLTIGFTTDNPSMSPTIAVNAVSQSPKIYFASNETSSSPTIYYAANETSAPTIEVSSNSPSAAPIIIGSQRLNPGNMYQYKAMMDNVTEGSEKVVCNVCGENGESKDPTKLVELDDGVTTCYALVEAGLSKVFTHKFCETKAKPIAELHCGCTRESLEADGTLKVDTLSSSTVYQQLDQDEVNVGKDSDSSAFSVSLIVAVVLLGWACTFIL